VAPKSIIPLIEASSAGLFSQYLHSPELPDVAPFQIGHRHKQGNVKTNLSEPLSAITTNSVAFGPQAKYTD
jgi:hypothetical protein